jgi:hypothetical protein
MEEAAIDAVGHFKIGKDTRICSGKIVKAPK